MRYPFDAVSNGVGRRAAEGPLAFCAMLALRVYDAVVALHVMAIVAAFGVVFAYPVVLPWLRKQHPGSMAVAHEVQGRLGRYVVTPAAILALVAGAYLASDADLWGEVWVVIPFVILVAILGVGGAVFAPTERRLVQLASGGVDSPEYDATFRRLFLAEVAVAVLVLVAIFLMVTKLGG